MGLAYLTRQQEVSSNNLSNVNTPGYKKETTIARSFPNILLSRLNDPAAAGDKPPVVGRLSMGVQLAEMVTDYSRGLIQQTANPLQMALMDEGYFTVETPYGERYTRNGEFQLDPQGYLVTSDGYNVMGQKGAINLAGGEFAVDEQGRIVMDGKEVDALRIVAFTDTPAKEGSSLFFSENVEDLAMPLVAQGFIESSNSTAIEEMINIISIARAYESSQRMIQTQDSTLEKAVNEVGRV
jgi:flagellar basal-body rod protein FlgG